MMQVSTFEYAAKVVCGEIDERGGPLAPGVYATEVNIHNPADRPAEVRKSLALTFPPGDQREGETRQLEEPHTLASRQAFAVDCRYLRDRLSIAEPFFIGFLIIESTQSFDVTAVYTTGGLEGSTAPGIAVEHIRERTAIT
jgi:hypothetical protein